MKKLDNRGFTLVELIGVIVILIIITAVAVPSISTSVEKAKLKTDEETSKSLEYAIELYLSDNKGKRANFYKNSGSCYILVSDLVDERYIMKDEIKSDNDYVVFEDDNIITKNNIGTKTKC